MTKFTGSVLQNSLGLTPPPPYTHTHKHTQMHCHFSEGSNLASDSKNIYNELRLHWGWKESHLHCREKFLNFFVEKEKLVTKFNKLSGWVFFQFEYTNITCYFISNSMQLCMAQTGWYLCIYSRTSMARTLMARLPRLFRTRSWVPRKKIPLLQIGDNLVWFSFLYWKRYIVC